MTAAPRLLSTVILLVVFNVCPVGAEHTPEPATVTVAGSLQSELGCPGDWQPDCADTHMALDAEDDVWQGVFTVPAGAWEYKAALNDSWDENYGANATQNGANIPLGLGAATAVKFYYSHDTHWITDNVNSVIAVAPGNFQSELGCANDWDPACLRSWLQDPDGDGVFTFRTRALPAGSFEAKVAIDESWDENYGAGGVQNGPNIPFTVPSDCTEMLFSFDYATKVLTVAPAPAPAQPGSVTIPGSFQDELGCPGDWQPWCAITDLAFDAEDTVWQGTFSIPAGNWEYKGALDGTWDVNYGLNAAQNGPNIPLALADPTDVKLYYSHETHWVTDNQGFRIASAPGSYQDEIGCSGDWQPWCLRSWLQDPDGDGVYSFSVWLPAGAYEAKVAIDESWDLNYGEGGVQNGPNIPFTVPSSCTEVVFTFNGASNILSIGTGTGGPVGNLNLARAHWVSEGIIAWNAGSAADTFTLHYDPNGTLALDPTGVVGGSSLTLTFDPAGLPATVTDLFPHLSGYHALRLDPGDLGLVPDILKGQIAVAAANSAGDPIDATSMQIPGVLDDLYFYSGDLGVVFGGGVPTLWLWAPTARSVTLHLFDDSDPATISTTVPMVLDPATGVWSVVGAADWDRRFYLYEVQVYTPSTTQVESNLVTDPYSLSLSLDSQRSQIVNLDDPDLKPPGWDALLKPPLDAFSDIVLYELHVRDFSIADPSVPEPLRGTFGAFAVPGSSGMLHLGQLAASGLTHVHLLPSFDIATVLENPGDRLEVDQAVLAAFAPDSPEQQAAIAAIKDLDGFNWGYDPWHYTVPDGAYANDPDGTARVLEFRQMVQGLAQAGLRVVMDVVYNHTNGAGQHERSVLDRIVPGYYHRLSLDGHVETSSCCPNTASEHLMMEKLLIDSVLTWVQGYQVDGFRFDLMGHHSKNNMLNLRAALDALPPAAGGVDGSQVYLYGEGWNFGEVANNARFEQATQHNMAGTGIGTFNDRTRDGVRGGNPYSDRREQGFINGLGYDQSAWENGNGDQTAELLHIADWIRIGLAGGIADFMFVDAAGNLVRADQVDYFGQQAGYTADPQENIAYVASHDNETLFDATQLKAPPATPMDDRVRIQNLGASIVLLGQGVPFVHAGQDIMRSKSMDRDSYDSGDWFNQIDWTGATTNWGHGLPTAEKNQSDWQIMQPLLADPALAPGPAHLARSRDHFNEMVRVRKSSKLFRLESGADVNAVVAFHNTGPGQVPGLIAMSLTDAGGTIDPAIATIVTLFNARDEPVAHQIVEFAGDGMILHPVLEESTDPVVHTTSFDSGTGIFSVAARTTAVFLQPLVDLSLLQVESPAVDPVVAGSGAGNLTYLLTVTNNGPWDAHAIAIAESLTLPAGVSFVSATASVGTLSGAAPNLVWSGFDLVSGASATLTVVLTVGSSTAAGSGVIAASAVLSSTAEGRYNTTDDSFAATTSVLAPTNVTGSKTVAGWFMPQLPVTYTIVLSNAGPADQPDAAGNELEDVLPAELELTGATAVTGTAAADPATNTVTWNGSIPAGTAVTITIEALVRVETRAGTVVSNQGTMYYDANGDGASSETRPTDDPGTGSIEDPTVFVARSAAIPVLGSLGLAILMTLLLLGGIAAARRLGSERVQH